LQERYREDPATFSAEISELEQLRAHACIRPSLSTAGTDTMKKYYCQLHFLKNRFNIRDGMFNFSWYDCYLGVVCNFSDIEYEMASVLYNAGAVHSTLGANGDRGRDSSEEMKVACTHFQCAAWIFHHLPDRFPRQMGSDLSVDLLAFLSQVSTAWALHLS
jgi:tyrosine-protein phosphatase non-receptor type 23